ncbi:MAG: phosphatidylglycerol lysyltransferase domain-containing protein [Clostridia bacterium]|nr:phosphatidylglycerol lysyltransferase domain-containing protein [Clostridia bacterium]
MIEYKAVTLEDKEKINKILTADPQIGSEYCFGNIYMWSEAYNAKIGFYKDFFMLKMKEDEKPYYSFPVGNGDLKECLDVLKNEGKEKNHEVSFYNVSKKNLEKLDKLVDCKFKITKNDGQGDYIYLVKDLAELKGKKYKSKRNHISYFLKNFEYEYEEINKDNLEECYQMSLEWNKLNKANIEEYESKEPQAIKRAFENFDYLGLVGALIRSNNKIIAYTFGEKINDYMFCTHVEKAYADVRGAYPLINQQFAENTINNFEYVNREEDLGIEGLRKAKQSYRPVMLLEKYYAICDD